jgi:Helix-turn-helix of DDE superfamily endonuclease
MGHPTYQDAIQTKNRLVALTGLEEDEFCSFLPYFSEALRDRMRVFTVEGNIRENTFAEYSNSPIPTDEDKLLFVMIFMKHNLSQEIIAFMYGMAQNKVHHWLYTLIPTLREALVKSEDMPARSKEEFEKALNASSGPLFVTTV